MRKDGEVPAPCAGRAGRRERVAGTALSLRPDGYAGLARVRDGRRLRLRRRPDLARERLAGTGDRRERALELRLIGDDVEQLGRCRMLEREQIDDVGV